MKSESLHPKSPTRHLVTVIYAHSLVVLLMAIAVSIPVFAMLTVACFFASMQLAAMWCVLGPGSYLRNSTWSLVGILCVGTASLFGCFLGTGGLVRFEEATKLASFGPVIWSIAQLPYWCIRLTRHWQIQFSGTAYSTTRRQVAIHDLMLYTVFVAISFALLQWGTAPAANFTGLETDSILSEFLIPVTIVLIVTFLSICLPAICLIFPAERSSRGQRNFWLTQGFLMAAVFFLILSIEPIAAFWSIIAIGGLVTSFAVTILAHRANDIFLVLNRRGHLRKLH